MNVGIYQAAAAMGASARWQELIAENLASSGLPGYRKQEMSFSAIQAGLLPVPTEGPQQYVIPRAQTGVKGRLRVVDFNQPGWLTPISHCYFAAHHPDLREQDVPNTTLRQGFVESANTPPIREMVKLMTAMRTFEANQKVVQTQDERMSRALAVLGNPG